LTQAAANQALGPPKEDGILATAQKYWTHQAEEGFAQADQGGICNKTLGYARAGISSILAGPGAATHDEANGFQQSVSKGLSDYQASHPGVKLHYDDPQRRDVKETKDFFLRTGGAQFNRAPASGDFPGGAVATHNLQDWLQGQVKDDHRVPMDQLIEHAVDANKGNVTLAMGSLAEIFHDNRDWAGKVDGMRNDGKDYYRFAGAYAALQDSKSTVALGYLGSMANIGGNPIVYGAAGSAQYVYGKVTGDQAVAQEGADLALSRTEIQPNVNKINEFHIGFQAGLGLRPEN
jgi:hypothetical protein